MSERAQKAWIRAGAQTPTVFGEVAGCARWMGIKLKTDEATPRTFAIVSAYHPDNSKSDAEITEFYDEYDDFLETCIDTTGFAFVGCDTNLPLGTRDNEVEEGIIGQYGRSARKKPQLRLPPSKPPPMTRIPRCKHSVPPQIPCCKQDVPPQNI
jgi:hypothetical protein